MLDTVNLGWGRVHRLHILCKTKDLADISRCHLDLPLCFISVKLLLRLCSLT